MIAAVLALAVASTPPVSPAGMLPLPSGRVLGQVGSWARYRASLPQQEDMYLRVGVVGEEKVQGADGSWVQWVFGVGPTSPMFAMKALLVKEDGRTRTVRAVSRVAGANATEMDVSKVKPAQFKPPDPEDGSLASSEETLLTPVGSLPAVKLALKNGMTLWYSEKVPVLGIAKLEMPDGRVLEIDAFGKDGAKDEVGEPQTNDGREPKQHKEVKP